MSDMDNIEKGWINRLLRWSNYIFGIVFIAIGAAILLKLLVPEHPLLTPVFRLLVGSAIAGYGIFKIRYNYRRTVKRIQTNEISDNQYNLRKKKSLD